MSATYGRVAERAVDSHKPARKRERQLVIRLTQDEYDDFADLAQRLGRSVSEAVRVAVGAALMGEQMRDHINHFDALEAT